MSNLRSDSEITRTQDATPDAPPATLTVAPLVLGLDTATDVRSVAVVRGKHVLASTSGRVLRENSARVLHDVEAVLAASGVKLDDIELFATTTGPGSFTGLRSGLATIKAFASTFERPVAGVPTLHAIAYGSGSAPRVLACLPAGRGEIFAQLLSFDGAKALRELSRPVHLSPAALLEKALAWGGDLKWAGPAAHAHAASIREFAAGQGIAWRVEEDDAEESYTENNGSWTLAPPQESYAIQVAALGLMHYQEGRTLVAEDLQALYVRLSDAELNERCRA
jgi:tRNA threonylcarbamoyladenosine biosynthesis protein TsaB